MKKILLSLFAALVIFLAAFALWNYSVYAPLGLRGYSKNDYQPAWETAAKGFCASSGLRYERPEFVTFRPFETFNGAYVWGVARAKTEDNRERLVWICLEWFSDHKVWRRSDVSMMADDNDEIYFTTTFPRQSVRAFYALSDIVQENIRRVREYLDWPGN